MKRVVVTGIGAVTPLANSFKGSWEASLEGRSGIGPQHIAKTKAATGSLKGFDAGTFLSDKELKRLDPFVHYALAAGIEAVLDSDLKGRGLGRAAVIIGSSRGGISMLEAAMLSGKRKSAFLMPATTIAMAAAFTAQKLGIRGPTLGISNSCSSGANAIGEAVRLIRHGYADTALAGGAEAPLCSLAIEGYAATGALSKEGVSRPFDAQRDGFVVAEGAAVLVLEEFGKAQKRGADIYGEITGYGSTSDALHQTAPDSGGQAGAIRAALSEAKARLGDVIHINAHATSTALGDKVEAETIGLVFGRKAGNIAIGAQKSQFGHMLAASGSLEAGFTLMSLKTGIVPPVINTDSPEFDLRVSNELMELPKRGKASVAISNSFGFGGVNAVLVFKGIGD